MAQPVLAARARQETGKGAARKLRQQGQVPAVFYGPGVEPMKLAVPYSDLERILTGVSGENVIIALEVETEGKKHRRSVMLKELQSDPVHEKYLHADFYEISMDKEITVNVAIQLNGTPIGVTNGGILENVRREVSVSCLPDKLTSAIDVDISHMDIGDALHIEDIELPEGMRALEDGHLTIAVVAAPVAEKEEEVEEVEELLEGEEASAESEETGAEESTEE
ncbi:MAG: 50S ribosomal protein L25 [Thermoplasmata archaeon]|nr:MAG: 50S ribosomal protein L25 [Thermoplasmata archaeon]